MKCRFKLILYFLIISFAASSQNLTGTWEGSSGNYCKLVILQLNDSCFGYTYDTGLGHCKANFVGTFKELSKNLVGLNPSFIEKSFFHTLSTYNLFYSKKGNIEYLRGTISPKSTGAKFMSLGLPQGIWYKKISDEIDTTKLMADKVQQQQPQITVHTIEKAEDVKQPGTKEDTIEIQKINSLPDLRLVKESRTSTLIKTLETATDSIRLVLYDNGEIDGDTVTVFYNGIIIYNSVPLSVRPLEISLAVSKTNAVNTIELMANNLGSIPPNTALLLIYAGNDRHELRVSSNYSTNARIDIKYIDSLR